MATRETPMERTLRARSAAHTRWAKEIDRSAATETARDGLHKRFEREVDPAGVLAPDELAKRVESARKAYFANLARLSAKSRREKKAAA